MAQPSQENSPVQQAQPPKQTPKDSEQESKHVFQVPTIQPTPTNPNPQAISQNPPADVPAKKSIFKKWWFWLIFVLIILGIGFGIYLFFK